MIPISLGKAEGLRMDAAVVRIREKLFMLSQNIPAILRCQHCSRLCRTVIRRYTDGEPDEIDLLGEQLTGLPEMVGPRASRIENNQHFGESVRNPRFADTVSITVKTFIDGIELGA